MLGWKIMNESNVNLNVVASCFFFGESSNCVELFFTMGCGPSASRGQVAEPSQPPQSKPSLSNNNNCNSTSFCCGTKLM